MNILETKTIVENGLTFQFDLIDWECGLSEFDNKWILDQDGLVVGSSGQKLDCTYYKIGTLKDGADVTKASAQKEFERDCEAFDVSLKVTVLKFDIELYSEFIISSDYSYDDNYSTEDLLNQLHKDYSSDLDEYEGQARKVLKQLSE